MHCFQWDLARCPEIYEVWYYMVSGIWKILYAKVMVDMHIETFKVKNVIFEHSWFNQGTQLMMSQYITIFVWSTHQILQVAIARNLRD